MSFLIVLFGVIAVLYASVGFGGGSSYSALLVAMSFSAAAIPLISLSCNLIVAAGGVAHHARTGSIPCRQALPLVALSVPAAWLGGRTPIAEDLFLLLLGVALICSGGVLLIGKTDAHAPRIVPSGPVLLVTGTGVGYLSGLAGIGGGIFLAPLLHLFRWNTPRRIAGIASLYILCNSAADRGRPHRRSGWIPARRCDPARTDVAGDDRDSRLRGRAPLALCCGAAHISGVTSINSSPLFDPFGRRIEYLRVSVTDRCDLRCQYCMAEQMTFLPRKDLLSIEELGRLTDAFIALGVRKVRLTGGEPLVRRGVMDFVRFLSARLHDGSLDELTLTTNGTQLRTHAEALAAAGVRRVNVSLDTLDGNEYRTLTRGGEITDVLSGIEAAKAAGIRVKINAVALRNTAPQLRRLIEWAHLEGHDVSLIEVMPLGDTGTDRTDQYVPLSEARADLEEVWTLVPSAHRTGGPSRYVDVLETEGRLGFITPLTNNFCEGCNRVRLTCTGRLYQCLGQEAHTDFRELMRAGIDDAGLQSAIVAAIARKPYAHDFIISKGAAPATPRHMSVTGG